MNGIITSTYLDALRVQFEAKFQEAILQADVWWQQLASEIPSNAESNLYGFVDNEATIREWIGERELQTLEESDYRLVNRHFEGTIKLNRDKISDDTLALFSQYTVPMYATRVAKFHDQQLAAIMLNNALCYDGGYFWSAAHANVGTAALDANGTAFAAARAALLNMVDPTGQPRYVGTQFTLVVSPDNERNARLCVAAEWGSVDGTVMATNVQRGMANVVVVQELVANPDRWGLFATGLPIKPLIVQTREGPNFVAHDNPQQHQQPFSANENVYGVDFRSAYGVSLPWLAYLSDPGGVGPT